MSAWDNFKESVKNSVNPKWVYENPKEALRNGGDPAGHGRQGGALGRPEAVSSDQYASNTMSQIHRAEWEDYKSRYLPRLQDSIAYATGDKPITEGVQRAGDSVDRAYQTSIGTNQRDLSRYGVSETAEESSNRSRLASISQGAEKVAAQNQTRLQVQDLQNSILAGGAASGLQSSRVDPSRRAA